MSRDSFVARVPRLLGVAFLGGTLASCGQSLPDEPTMTSQTSAAQGNGVSVTGANGSTSTTNRITLNRPTVAAPAAGLWPTVGDSVTFSSTYPSKLDHYGVRIQVVCSRSGEVLYGEAGPKDQAFLLGGASSRWLTVGGPASCKADLYYWSYQGKQEFNLLATTSFDSY